MNYEGVPRVGAIGSCRVHTPMKHAESAGLLTYLRHTGFGYVHNPYEVEQIIALTTGVAQRPPRELSRLMAILKWRTLTPTSFAETCGGGDGLVIELSSVRALRYRGRYFQIHRFREFLKQYGTTIMNGKFFEDRDSARASLMETASRMPDDWARAVVEEVEFWEMTEDEIRVCLKRIYDATSQPLTFVNIVTTTGTGAAIQNREMLRDVISAFVARNDRAVLFDPTVPVMQTGYAAAMKDSSHYQPHYEPAVGQLLADSVIDRLGRSA